MARLCQIWYDLDCAALRPVEVPGRLTPYSILSTTKEIRNMRIEVDSCQFQDEQHSVYALCLVTKYRVLLESQKEKPKSWKCSNNLHISD
jgi:hypothetical protein